MDAGRVIASVSSTSEGWKKLRPQLSESGLVHFENFHIFVLYTTSFDKRFDITQDDKFELWLSVICFILIRRYLTYRKYLQLCGLVCVGIGTWLVLDRYAVDSLAIASEKVQVTDDGLRELASKPAAVRQIGFLLIIGGIIVIVVSFMGCCGAAKEWRLLLCCVSYHCLGQFAYSLVNIIF
ncbi:unnamed protein product [Brugia timori]|uniref:DUF4203 domain-containing protein n=1 Tax=Brugia timori TaxID=42155 RepID=A0A0R3R596_9BILA|nr:unnamed protein product [Brugia timori]